MSCAATASSHGLRIRVPGVPEGHSGKKPKEKVIMAPRHDTHIDADLVRRMAEMRLSLGEEQPFHQRIGRAIEEQVGEGDAELLGRGTFGNVYRVTMEGNQYAVKIPRLGMEDGKLMRREYAFADKLPMHDSLVKVYLVGETYLGGRETSFIAMECLKGKPLIDSLVMDRNRNFHLALRGAGVLSQQLLEGSEAGATIMEGRVARVQKFIRSIAGAMQALDQEGLTFRDLKLDNIMLSEDDKVTLYDYGMMRDLTSSSGVPKKWDEDATDAREGSLTPCGTLEYLAPELLDYGTQTRYSKKIDIWSFGSTLHNLVTGKQVYLGKRGEGEVIRVSSRLPESLHDLIDACVAKDPERRPSWEEILEHPFMREEPKDFIEEFKEIVRRAS